MTAPPPETDEAIADYTALIEIRGGKGAVDEEGKPTSYLKPQNPKASGQ